MAVDSEALSNAIKVASALKANQGITTPETGPSNKSVLSPLGKVLDALDTDLNLVTEGMKPVVTFLNPDLKKVYDAKPGNTVPSDLIDAAIPGKGIHKFALGFAADVLFSPTTYITGIGGFTKAAKVAKAAKGAEELGVTVKAGSKLALDIEKEFGPGVAGIAKARRGISPSLAEQARQGQRALIHVGIPFSGIDVPIIKGQAILARLGEAGEALKDSNLGKAFNKIFSTSSGNPKFDKLRMEFVALANARKDEALRKSVDYAKQVRTLAKNLNVSYEEIDSALFNLVENPHYGGINADVLRSINDNAITNWKMYANGALDKKVNNLLGYGGLSASEKLKMHRKITRELLTQQSGVNVYTAGLRLLPPEYINEFSNLFTRQAAVKILQDTNLKGKSFKFADMAALMNAKLHGVKLKGVELSETDAIVHTLSGTKEWKRIKALHEELMAASKNPQFNLLPKSISETLNTGTEYKQLEAVGREIIGHIDTSFALNHALYRTNPTYLKKINPAVHDIFSRLYKDKNWQIGALVEQFKVAGDIARKYPGLFEAAQNMRRMNQNQLMMEQTSGVGTGRLIADINYLTHIPNKEVREFLQKTYGRFQGVGRQWNPEHANMLQRAFSRVERIRLNEAFNSNLITKAQYLNIRKNGMKSLNRYVKLGDISLETASRVTHVLTREEVDVLAKTGKLKILGKQKFANGFFDANPSNVFRVRSSRGEVARTAEEFFQSIKENDFGIPIRDGAFPPGYRPVKAKGLEGLAFENGVADWIDKTYNNVIIPPGSHPFLHMFDKLQDSWKAWTLAIWPSYHTRNFVGNIWNNFLAGMSTPKEWENYFTANSIQSVMDRNALQAIKGAGASLADIEANPTALAKLKGIKITIPSGHTLDGQQIIRAGNEQGIFNIGQYWGDVAHYFEQDAKDILNAGVRNPIISGGLRTGNAIQNNANLAHFIWRLKEGDSFQEAARSVKKYQFDYADLSDTEREIFRRVIPFYSWTRKNVPLQIEALLTQPAKAMGVLKFKDAVESNADGYPDERLLPDWMVKSQPIRVRLNPKTKNYEYFLLDGWLPLGDIDKIFDPAKNLANMLSPIIKEPFQQLANKDFFTDREIDTGGEYERLAGINMPKRAAHVLKNIRLLSETQRWTDEDNTLETNITRTALGRFYPFNQEKERIGREIELSRKESNLRRLLKRAESKADQGEIKRLLNEIEAVNIAQSQL